MVFRGRKLRFSVLLLTSILWTCEAVLPPPCDSPVYCQPGEENLLHVVQMAKLSKDSKTFVDKPMKLPQDQVLANFRAMMTVIRY